MRFKRVDNYDPNPFSRTALLSQLPVIIVGDFFVNFIFITQVRTKEYILRESESPLNQCFHF